MSNKIFVGGISWGTSEQDLAEHFGTVGTVVEAKIITDRETGRSRGFGFITFENNEGVTQAIEKFDGTELDGRNIRVNQAEENSRRNNGGDRGNRRY